MKINEKFYSIEMKSSCQIYKFIKLFKWTLQRKFNIDLLIVVGWCNVNQDCSPNCEYDKQLYGFVIPQCIRHHCFCKV